MRGSVGDAVKAARTRRGWSQAELAQAAGVSEATVSRIERGWHEQPKAGTLEALATALGVERTLLVVGVSGGDVHQRLGDLSRCFHALDDEDQVRLLDLCNRFARGRVVEERG